MAQRKDPSSDKAAFSLDQQTFQQMFNGHSAIMLLIEPESGKILDANQAAIDFYGYSHAILRGMSINEINTLPAKLVKEERQKAISGEKKFFVFSHRHAGGEESLVEVHSSPVILGEKRVLFSIIHDVTERVKTKKGSLSPSISLGIAQTIHHENKSDSIENLFLRADQALYAAKQAGRNRTATFDTKS